jgi:hypothetical protein
VPEISGPLRVEIQGQPLGRFSSAAGHEEAVAEAIVASDQDYAPTM